MLDAGGVGGQAQLRAAAERKIKLANQNIQETINLLIERVQQIQHADSDPEATRELNQRLRALQQILAKRQRQVGRKGVRSEAQSVVRRVRPRQLCRSVAITAITISSCWKGNTMPIGTTNRQIPGCGTHHIALQTRDWEASLRLYRDVLGMQIVAEFGPPERRILLLDIGDGSHMELFAPHASRR